MPLIILALLAAVVGVLIGSVGVGGVALPPFLTWFAGMDPHVAAGTSNWAFLFTGVVGTVMYARHAAMPWRLVRRLSIGIAPAAVAGAIVNGLVPDAYAMLPLALLVTAAGAHHLSRLARGPATDHDFDPDQLRTAPAIAVGAAVGFASALTGTGGPVFLVPALLALRVPALPAVAAAQVIQVPLVAFAVLGYAPNGSVDFGLGTLIGVVAGMGVIAGAAIAMRLPRRVLSRVTGVALAGFGIALLASSLWAILT